MIKHLTPRTEVEINYLNNWEIGDEFTTPETGDKIFKVIEVNKDDVQAYDGRSRAWISSFAKWYITKKQK
jgi:hypothetical protein